MRTFKILCLFLLLSPSLHTFGVEPQRTSMFTSLYPDKTIIIKDQAYTNAASYFGNVTTLSFEVYKAGNQASVNQIIGAFQGKQGVQSMVATKATGDFQGFTLNLSSAKTKSWFIQHFKSAGLNTIVINHDPITDVDKL